MIGTVRVFSSTCFSTHGNLRNARQVGCIGLLHSPLHSFNHRLKILFRNSRKIFGLQPVGNFTVFNFFYHMRCKVVTPVGNGCAVIGQLHGSNAQLTLPNSQRTHRQSIPPSGSVNPLVIRCFRKTSRYLPRNINIQFLTDTKIQYMFPPGIISLCRSWVFGKNRTKCIP